ncbi:MAG: 13E12 repeat family protein, partial [Frankiaceae bacterium]|nr:13E12 repeat family protein [Frankiaceae bacterium]
MQGIDPDNVVDTAGWKTLLESGWQFGDPIPDQLPDQLQRPGGPCSTPRSHARRWHDALKLLLRATLDSAALGQRDKAAPHLDVTTSLAALNSDPGARPATGASGARLPLSLVKTWWCDAHITRYVLG